MSLRHTIGNNILVDNFSNIDKLSLCGDANTPIRATEQEAVSRFERLSHSKSTLNWFAIAPLRCSPATNHILKRRL